MKNNTKYFIREHINLRPCTEELGAYGEEMGAGI